MKPPSRRLRLCCYQLKTKYDSTKAIVPSVVTHLKMYRFPDSMRSLLIKEHSEKLVGSLIRRPRGVSYALIDACRTQSATRTSRARVKYKHWMTTQRRRVHSIWNPKKASRTMS